MALGIATGKREEVVTLIFSGNVNKGQRIRVGGGCRSFGIARFPDLSVTQVLFNGFSKLSVG